ncbi:hypothetical protein GCM10022255_106940 [Dactylosporangium darangshiense]|uniref:Uncharacterized protein n=1 Tax=Dactylosporangium darangshiense TaxID=579108 RepID=A0ABP8DTL7_9ACTN
MTGQFLDCGSAPDITENRQPLLALYVSARSAPEPVLSPTVIGIERPGVPPANAFSKSRTMAYSPRSCEVAAIAFRETVMNGRAAESFAKLPRLDSGASFGSLRLLEAIHLHR